MDPVAYGEIFGVALSIHALTLLELASSTIDATQTDVST